MFKKVKHQRISKLFNIVLSMILCMLSSVAFAQTAAKDTDNTLVFEVIQDQFILDHSTVKNAQLQHDQNGKYEGISITLKEAAAKDLTELTKNSVSKHANIVFNNKIVSTTTIGSSLGDKFLIPGISREDAAAFIQKLNLQKPDIVARNN